MNNNKLSIGKRFLKEREKFEKNRSKFSRLAKIADSTIRKWEKGTEIPGSAIGKLEEAGLDMNYVLTGKRKEPQSIELPDIAPEDFIEIPFYGDEIAAGQPLEVRDNPIGIVIVHRDWCRNPANMVAVKVSSSGTSMEPTIPAGAIVTIDHSQTTPELLYGKVIAIYKAHNGATIKRLGKTDRGWCGIPDNRDPEHTIITINPDEGDRIIGKVNTVHYSL